MPQLDTLSWVLWGLTIAVQFALVFILRRQWRQWRAICTFALFHAITSCLLLGVILADNGVGDFIPALYFYVFWTKQAVSALLELWVIAELGCNVAPALGRVLYGAVASFAAIFLLAAMFLVAAADDTFTLAATRWAVLGVRCVSLAWLATFVTLYFASELTGVAWRPRALGVGIGITIKAIGETACGWMLGEWPQSWGLLSDFEGSIWIIALCVWCATFLQGEPPAKAPPTVEELLPAARSMFETIKRFLGTK